MSEAPYLRQLNKPVLRERPDQVPYVLTMPRGISEKTVKAISQLKNEPAWLREQRLSAYWIFLRKKMPSWGPDLSGLDFHDIHYYLKPTAAVVRKWQDVPLAIRRTYRRLGLPQAEQKYLAGVMAQYDSEPVYHGFRDKIAKLGVIFTDMDTAWRKYPELFRKYFSSVVPVSDNKFAALNNAVWSGGSFVYVPAGVKVAFPLQAYFRINAEKVGQFEHTLIIAEAGSQVHYVEGCTAPMYSTESLHSGVVEIVVKRGARVRYTTIQNWSKNVYNLVTQRSHVYEEGIMEWVDGNLGSKVTMKYPAVYLLGRRACGSILSIALAGQGQHQDAGAKAVHLAPETSSTIVAKSVSYAGGRSAYRGLVRVPRGMNGVKSNAVCDALLLDKKSRSDTYPTLDVMDSRSQVSHEAHVGKVSEEQLFYLQSRGLAEQEAMSMIISGFIEPIARELPVEYAAELNQLIQMVMKH